MTELARLVLAWASADEDVKARGWDSATEAAWERARAAMVAEAERAAKTAGFAVELSRDGDCWYVGLPNGTPDVRISAATAEEARDVLADWIYNELDGAEDVFA